MRHPKLKPNWTFPVEMSDKFINECASGNIDIEEDQVDIIRNGRTYKQYKESDLKLEWPWIKGYNPKTEDWQSIGFKVYYKFDSCFAAIPKEDMFKCWLNKE